MFCNFRHVSCRAREVSHVLENKSQRDAQNGDIYATEIKVPRNSRDGNNGSKQSHLGASPIDNNRTGLNKSPAVNGRGISLQRELSDLELGELRESTPDETIIGKQFERKGSFKLMENKANTSEDVNLNIGKVKPSLKATLDSGRRTSVLSSGFPSNLENTNKKNVDYHFEDSTKSRSRVMQTQSQHLKSDNADVGSQNKLAEMSTKFRNSESGVSHDIDLDGRRGSNRRVPANGSKQDTKRGMGSYPVKESKRQTPNSGEEVPEGRKDSVFVDRSNGDQKKRESSSDENSCSYSKFEKEEPELKGPIKTFSQYKEYVQEYADKYQSYLSLNKILMDYKDEFDKLGVDLENAQRNGDQDRYDDIGAQIMESYRRCASRHMRLKKIFVVLHEELHHGYVRGMGLGPTPSQINGSSCRPSGSTSSSTADAKIAKMQSEIDVLTKEVAEVNELKAKVAEFDAMKEQFALIMANMQNHGSNIESPFEVRRSSESSHNVEGDQATPDD